MQMHKLLVTGTNRGLGKELVNHLAKNRPDLHLFLTARGDPIQAQKSWSQNYPDNTITCLQLDLMDKDSTLRDKSGMNRFFKNLEEKQWNFRYLANNAAIGADLGGQIPSVDLATRTFQCNVTSTIAFTKQMLNYLSEDAKIVMVSSGIAGLKYQPNQDKQKLLDNPDLTQQQLQEYINDYISECKNQKMTWFQSAYGTSKLFLNSWSRFILQAKLFKEGQTVVCMSPGPCMTDMAPPNPKYTAVEGAKFIYDCLFNKYQKGKFIHTGNQRDFQWCGVPK